MQEQLVTSKIFYLEMSALSSCNFDPERERKWAEICICKFSKLGNLSEDSFILSAPDYIMGRAECMCSVCTACMCPCLLAYLACDSLPKAEEVVTPDLQLWTAPHWGCWVHVTLGNEQISYIGLINRDWPLSALFLLFLGKFSCLCGSACTLCLLFVWQVPSLRST